MKGLYKILVIIIIVLLCLPAIQYFTNFPRVRQLKGVYVESNPVFNFKNYINFTFQKEAMTYIEQNFGYRPVFIRSYNQFMFSCFKQSQGNGVIVGKEQYLYEHWFIDESMSGNYLSWEEIINSVKKLSVIRKFLKEYDTELLVVLAPGKSYYYPEYIPDHYKQTKKYTNYSRYAHYLKKSDIPTFDINKWFMLLKGHEEAPLFPKTGTHWSYYGSHITGDSILAIAEQLLNRELNRYTIDSLVWSDTPRNEDRDLEELSNLMFPIKSIPHAYPVITHDKKYAKEDLPSVTVIADSFFWQLFNHPVLHSFNNIWYWYYYNSIYPSEPYKTVSDLDVDLQLKNTNLIMLLTSTAGLYKIGYGFIEEAYNLAIKDQKLREAKINELTLEILSSDEKLNIVKNYAKVNGITLDSAITEEATKKTRTELRELFAYPNYPLSKKNIDK